MNIAIIGRTRKLLSTAEELGNEGHNIKLVVTGKAAPEYAVGSADFEQLAEQYGARFLHSAKLRDHLDVIGACEPLDVGISVNYPGIIPQKVIDKFPLGILNAHGGDLPRYRGNACQAWAILNGENHIGLCIHKMIGGEVDSGDIIVREYLPIDHNTRIGEVWNWMEKNIPQMFKEAVDRLARDPSYILERQSTDPKDTLRCYPRRPSDGRIDWTQSNLDILRLINASSQPFSGAFCMYKDEQITIWRAYLPEPDQENYCAVPGQVSHVDLNTGDVTVITGTGKLVVTEVEYQGKRDQPATFFTSIRDRLE